MLTVAVLVGLLACVSAHGNGMMGNFGNGMYGNMGYGYMGNNMGMSQMGNQGMGNQGQLSQLFGLLAGHMNSGRNGGTMNGNMGGSMGGGMGSSNQGGGNQGGGNQGGIMGSVMMLILQSVLQNRGGNQGNQGNQGNHDQQWSKDEMEGVEGMMKKKMMIEMADMMMVYMDFKEKEKEFGKAMDYMCFMVNATYEAFGRNNTKVFNKTTEESMKALGQKVEAMTDNTQMEFAINMLNVERQTFSEIFLRFATLSCMTGDSYMKAAHKMEKMKDEGECDHK